MSDFTNQNSRFIVIDEQLFNFLLNQVLSGQFPGVGSVNQLVEDVLLECDSRAVYTLCIGACGRESGKGPISRKSIRISKALFRDLQEVQLRLKEYGVSADLTSILTLQILRGLARNGYHVESNHVCPLLSEGCRLSIERMIALNVKEDTVEEWLCNQKNPGYLVPSLVYWTDGEFHVDEIPT